MKNVTSARCIAALCAVAAASYSGRMSDSAQTPLLVHHLPDAPDGVPSDAELPAPSDRFVLRDGRQAWLRVRPQGAAGVLGLLVTLADDPTIIGEAGCVPRPTMLAAELALAVARSWRCQGIGSVLVEVLCRAVRHAGVGQVMATLPAHDTKRARPGRAQWLHAAAASGRPRPAAGLAPAAAAPGLDAGAAAGLGARPAGRLVAPEPRAQFVPLRADDRRAGAAVPGQIR